jgi:hypothetical protein
VPTGILYHVGNQHQPAAAFLTKIHSQSFQRMGLPVLLFYFRLFLEWIEFLIQLSDSSKGNVSQTHAWVSQPHRFLSAAGWVR